MEARKCRLHGSIPWGRIVSQKIKLPLDRLGACPEQAAQAARRREKMKRWGKSPPRFAARRTARKTPSGARQNKRLDGSSHSLGYVAPSEASRKRSVGGCALHSSARSDGGRKRNDGRTPTLSGGTESGLPAPKLRHFYTPSFGFVAGPSRNSHATGAGSVA